MSIQAGTVNSAAIRVRFGFSGHVHAWNDDEIDYYAHAVPVEAPSEDARYGPCVCTCVDLPQG